MELTVLLTMILASMVRNQRLIAIWYAIMIKEESVEVHGGTVLLNSKKYSLTRKELFFLFSSNGNLNSLRLNNTRLK